MKCKSKNKQPLEKYEKERRKLVESTTVEPQFKPVLRG